MVAVFVGELRNLLECLAGFGDEADNQQAQQQVASSSRGSSFLECGLWFAVTFLNKRISPGTLKPEHVRRLEGEPASARLRSN